MGQRQGRGVAGHVGSARAEQHLDDVRALAVDVVLEPLQPRAHVQQVVERDRPSGDRRRPTTPGHAGGASRSSRPSPTRTPTRRVEDALGHRPRRQGRVGVDADAVALDHEPAALRPPAPRSWCRIESVAVLGEEPVEERVEALDRVEPGERPWPTRRSATAPLPAGPGAGSAEAGAPGSPTQEPDDGTVPSVGQDVVSSASPSVTATRSVAFPVPLPFPLLLGLAPPSSWRAMDEAGHALAQRLGERVAQALGAVEHDHLVDVAERLGRRLDDGRPVARPAAGR